MGIFENHLKNSQPSLEFDNSSKRCSRNIIWSLKRTQKSLLLHDWTCILLSLTIFTQKQIIFFEMRISHKCSVMLMMMLHTFELSRLFRTYANCSFFHKFTPLVDFKHQSIVVFYVLSPSLPLTAIILKVFCQSPSECNVCNLKCIWAQNCYFQNWKQRICF